MFYDFEKDDTSGVCFDRHPILAFCGAEDALTDEIMLKRITSFSKFHLYAEMGT